MPSDGRRLQYVDLYGSVDHGLRATAPHFRSFDEPSGYYGRAGRHLLEYDEPYDPAVPGLRAEAARQRMQSLYVTEPLNTISYRPSR